MNRYTLTALGALLLSTTACGAPGNPCNDLSNPTREDIASAAQGREIEIETEDNWGQEVECVVQGRDWVKASDDES